MVGPDSVAVMKGIHDQLENTFLDEFYQVHGIDRTTLSSLPEPKQHEIRVAASVYAGSKLAEIQARAQYIHDIHSTK